MTDPLSVTTFFFCSNSALCLVCIGAPWLVSSCSGCVLEESLEVGRKLWCGSPVTSHLLSFWKKLKTVVSFFSDFNISAGTKSTVDNGKTLKAEPPAANGFILASWEPAPVPALSTVQSPCRQLAHSQTQHSPH